MGSYPLSQWVYGAFWLPIMAALYWSLFASHFVPSAKGDGLAFCVSMFIAVLAGIYAWRSPAFSPDNLRFQTLSVRFPGLASAKTRIPIFVAAAFMFTFPATQRGFLDWWTSATGVSGLYVAHIASYGTRGWVTCSGLDVQESPFILGRAVCVDLSYPGPPTGTPITFYGKRTPFGIAVERYQIAGSG